VIFLNYFSYKNARDASWAFLIEFGIFELPVNIKPILNSMNITVRKDYSDLAGNERGYSVFENNAYQIVVPDCSIPQKRYTIMHEVGHIVMKHIQDKPEYEYEAERFAIDVLAPACVLWGLKIRDPEEIASLCNISVTSARIRAERMELLYKREQDFLKIRGHSCFLQSPLERKVYQQYQRFIEKNKQ
jgi:hypothetical protein